MHPIVYYIIIFLVIGGAGMAVANRQAEPAVRKQRWLKYFMYILITGTIIISMFQHFFFWIAAIIGIASGIELYRVNKSSIQKSKRTFSSLAFLLVVAGFMFFAGTFNAPFLLFVYFQVLVFDGFCQVSGQIFGRHLLAPAISPTKTWEGLAGGWLCCVVAGWLAAVWLPDLAGMRYMGIVFGLATGLISFYGDLLASYYKRIAGVKDYSDWLPGQGGFLDRFDSFLLTGALYYLLFILIFRQAFSGFIKTG